MFAFSSRCLSIVFRLKSSRDKLPISPTHSPNAIIRLSRSIVNMLVRLWFITAPISNDSSDFPWPEIPTRTRSTNYFQSAAALSLIPRGDPLGLLGRLRAKLWGSIQSAAAREASQATLCRSFVKVAMTSSDRSGHSTRSIHSCFDDGQQESGQMDAALRPKRRISQCQDALAGCQSGHPGLTTRSVWRPPRARRSLEAAERPKLRLYVRQRHSKRPQCSNGELCPANLLSLIQAIPLYLL